MRTVLVVWLILAPVAPAAQESSGAGSSTDTTSVATEDTESAKIKSDAQKKAEAIRKFCADPANAGTPPCPPASGK